MRSPRGVAHEAAARPRRDRPAACPGPSGSYNPLYEAGGRFLTRNSAESGFRLIWAGFRVVRVCVLTGSSAAGLCLAAAAAPALAQNGHADANPGRAVVP